MSLFDNTDHLLRTFSIYLHFFCTGSPPPPPHASHLAAHLLSFRYQLRFYLARHFMDCLFALFLEKSSPSSSLIPLGFIYFNPHFIGLMAVGFSCCYIFEIDCILLLGFIFVVWYPGSLIAEGQHINLLNK